jgi:hypothetical protein
MTDAEFKGKAENAQMHVNLPKPVNVSNLNIHAYDFIGLYRL